MRAMMEDADAFPAALRAVLKEDLKVSVVEFAEASGIPQPTIYKLLSGEHEPNLRTVRMCVRAIIALEGGRTGGFVAVVAPPPTLSRLALDRIGRETGAVLRPYSASTAEDAVVAGVWAEREGAVAVVAGPLESASLRRALTVDVVAPDPTEPFEAAVRRAAESAGRVPTGQAGSALPSHPSAGSSRA
jgi:predicted transcriptional regulator